MKKLVLTIMFTMAVATASFYAQVMHFILPERTTDKNIHLAIKAESGYRNPVYAHSVAQLYVAVYKVKKKKTTMVWQHEYPDFSLSKLPVRTPKILETIHVPDIKDNKEQVIIQTIVTYKSNGSHLKINQVMPIAKGTNNDKFCVKL